MQFLPRAAFVIHSPLPIEHARKGLRRELATLSGRLLGEFDGRQLFALVDLAVAPLVEIRAKLEEWPTKRRATLRGEIRLSQVGLVSCGMFLVGGSAFVSVILVARGAGPFFAVVPVVGLLLLPVVQVIWRANAQGARRVLERTLRATATVPRARKLIRSSPAPRYVQREVLEGPLTPPRDPYRSRLQRPAAPVRARMSMLTSMWRKLRACFVT